LAGVLGKRREGSSTAAAGAGAAAMGADKFLLCGSFVLGEVIDRKVEEVVSRLRLQREVVALGEIVENKEMWMHVYILHPPTHS
jgi:hypothetical protein